MVGPCVHKQKHPCVGLKLNSSGKKEEVGKPKESLIRITEEEMREKDKTWNWLKWPAQENYEWGSIFVPMLQTKLRERVHSWSGWISKDLMDCWWRKTQLKRLAPTSGCFWQHNWPLHWRSQHKTRPWGPPVLSAGVAAHCALRKQYLSTPRRCQSYHRSLEGMPNCTTCSEKNIDVDIFVMVIVVVFIVFSC